MNRQIKQDMQSDPSSLSGMHIYHDEKGRTIYYQPRKMIGYVIEDKHVKTYRTLSNRYLIAVLSGLLLYIVLGDQGLPIWVCLLLFCGVLALLEYRFHKLFLPKLVQLKQFVPKDKPGLIITIAQQEDWRLISKIILYPLFGILLMILFYERQQEAYHTTPLQNSAILIFGVFVLIFTCIYGSLNLRALFYRRAHKENKTVPKKYSGKQKK